MGVRHRTEVTQNICIKVPTMNLSLLFLLSVFSLALSMPSNTETKEVEMRYGSRNRDCPIRNKTTKKNRNTEGMQSSERNMDRILAKVWDHLHQDERLSGMDIQVWLVLSL